MNTQEILSLNTTKTKKIELLLLQGFSRKEVANLIANGNYGFVQNVYAKMKAEGRLNLTFTPTEFNRRFGIEIEAYNIDKDKLRRALKCAGIDCRIGNRNDTNRHYWKIVEDDSIEGHKPFELVSPVLQDTAGLEKVKKVCQILKELNAYVNKTCGLHIHFAFMQGMSKRLTITYGWKVRCDSPENFIEDLIEYQWLRIPPTNLSDLCSS